MEFEASIFYLQLITFSLGLLLAYFVYVPYLKGWMTERQNRIASQLEEAAKNQKSAEALKTDLDRKMKEMDAKVQQTLADSRAEADKARQEAAANARKEAEKILADTRAALEQERHDTLLAVQREVAALSVAIAEKILRSSVDAKAQQKLIDESLKELTSKKN